MTAVQIEIQGQSIQYDASGVGHAWRAATEIDCPASIQEEIAAEIVDGKNENREDFTGALRSEGETVRRRSP